MNEIDVAYKFFLYPVLSSMFYLTTCKCLGSFHHELNGLYKHNQFYKCALKFVGATYNLIMSVYSGATFSLPCRALLNDYGTVIDYSAWHVNHLIESNEVARLCWIFLHSKTVEYFDTFFILLKGGTPIFLQEFHHFGAVWSWFLSLYVNSSIVIITTLLNSFVHTVMYLYYFLSVFDTHKMLLPIKPVITTLQLVQLCGGLYISFSEYISRHVHNLDHKLMAPVYFSQLYVFILILLFLHFSYSQYIKKKRG